MKHNKSNRLFAASIAFIALVACTKVNNTIYRTGTAPVLSSSVTSIAPTPADSLSNALVLAWTAPKYDTPYPGPALYTIQLDSAGHGFASPIIYTVNTLSDSMTAQQINTAVLGMGGNFGVPFGLEVRVISSYANNNEPLVSNTVNIQFTPYKTPPKVAPPASGQLFLIGNASQGGWNTPVPVPTQQFEKIDSVDFGGVFNLTAGGQYLVLATNDGSYDNKYATNDGTPLGTGGTFAAGASNNFAGPATAGWYSIVMNFQTGIITVTPYSSVFPTNLYIVGDATPGGWNNPVPVPSQQMTQVNAAQFKVTLPLVAGGGYLMLPVNGDWTNKYAVGSTDAGISGGTFGYDLSNNFTGPAAAGTYTITADFLTWKYSVTQ